MVSRKLDPIEVDFWSDLVTGPVSKHPARSLNVWHFEVLADVHRQPVQFPQQQAINKHRHLKMVKSWWGKWSQGDTL